MNKIIFITNRFPYPVKDGREKMLLQALLCLSREDVEIYMYSFEKKLTEEIINGKNELEHMMRSIKRITLIPLPNLIHSLKNAVYFSLLGDKSIQESFFYSKKIKDYFLNEIALIKPHIIYCDMIRTAQFIEDVNSEGLIKILDMDDLFSRRYRLLVSTNTLNPLGSFEKNIPRFAKILHINKLRKKILELEADRMEKREIALVNKFDRVILVSPVESSELRKKTKSNNIDYIYPAVSEIEPSVTCEKIPYSLSFMGALNKPHNKEGLIYFIENIFPLILKKCQETKFYIVGGEVSQQILNIAKEKYSQNIIFTGYVKDYRNIISKTQVFVAPIYFGTGIKTKLIDVMSLGVPVVTTGEGIKGLMAEHDKNILVANSNEEFVTDVIELINNEKLYVKISSNAIKYILEYHSLNKIRPKFLGLLGINEKVAV